MTDHHPGADRAGASATRVWPLPSDAEATTADAAHGFVPAVARQTVTAREADARAGAGASLGSQVWAAVQPGDAPRTPPGGLPLPGPPPPAGSPAAHYTVTAMDARGRLADRSPLAALGWPTGLPVTFRVITGGVLVVAAPDGPDAVTRQGHLRLPAPLRHLFRLRAGDRLLVAAFPGPGYLIAHPVTALDQMLLDYHTAARRTP
jgi:hypothetical protein